MCLRRGARLASLGQWTRCGGHVGVGPAGSAGFSAQAVCVRRLGAGRPARRAVVGGRLAGSPVFLRIAMAAAAAAPRPGRSRVARAAPQRRGFGLGRASARPWPSWPRPGSDLLLHRPRCLRAARPCPGPAHVRVRPRGELVAHCRRCQPLPRRVGPRLWSRRPSASGASRCDLPARPSCRRRGRARSSACSPSSLLSSGTSASISIVARDSGPRPFPGRARSIMARRRVQAGGPADPPLFRGRAGGRTPPAMRGFCS